MNKSKNIDDEWTKFMTHSSNYDEDDEDDEYELENMEIFDPNYASTIPNSIQEDGKGGAPTPSNIYISTKTKISYLNREIDLKNVFWKIPLVPYSVPKEGVIKKQMKFNSLEEQELEDIQNHLRETQHYHEEYIITSINNPKGRIKFKDIRKVSIGISKKDLISYRCKKKSAFYNCFVLILRLNILNDFREFHVKIFNTGKFEIPGIQSDETFSLVLKKVVYILQPFVEETLFYNEELAETVLINSNFTSGFYINRDKLYDILKKKYNIPCIFDPCSYPGIQCKFYYGKTDVPLDETHLTNKEIKDTKKAVSFMIFRTGSILIVGKCDETVLYEIYNYIKKILIDEYKEIVTCNVEMETMEKKDVKKKKKIRKRIISIE